MVDKYTRVNEVLLIIVELYARITHSRFRYIGIRCIPFNPILFHQWKYTQRKIANKTFWECFICLISFRVYFYFLHAINFDDGKKVKIRVFPILVFKLVEFIWLVKLDKCIMNSRIDCPWIVIYNTYVFNYSCMCVHYLLPCICKLIFYLWVIEQT